MVVDYTGRQWIYLYWDEPFRFGRVEVSIFGRRSMMVAKNTIYVKAFPNLFKNGGSTRLVGQKKWWLESG